jgi:hypothetical protein
VLSVCAAGAACHRQPTLTAACCPNHAGLAAMMLICPPVLPWLPQQGQLAPRMLLTSTPTCGWSCWWCWRCRWADNLRLHCIHAHSTIGGALHHTAELGSKQSCASSSQGRQTDSSNRTQNILLHCCIHQNACCQLSARTQHTALAPALSSLASTLTHALTCLHTCL